MRVLSISSTEIEINTVKYRICKEIGTDNNSKTYLAENLLDNKIYGVKLFAEGDERNVPEISIMSKINHDSIIEWKESMRSNEVSFCNKEDEEAFKVSKLERGFVVEYPKKGNLLDLIENLTMLPEIVARAYAKQLMNAVEHLHSQHVTHRDIKLDNLFLDENDCLKLGGFGISKIFSEGTMCTEKVGTERYYAPEILLGAEYDPFAADVFAIGVTIFGLVCGYFPFSNASFDDELYSLIIDQNWDEFWLLHEEIYPNNPVSQRMCLREFFERLLCPNPAERVTIKEIKNLSWMKMFILDKMQVGSWITEIAKKQKKDSSFSSC